ncbi:MAG: hypothetical protein QOH31_1365 [Verrucomicrobiota bacterium]|jgi:hypothetical protein
MISQTLQFTTNDALRPFGPAAAPRRARLCIGEADDAIIESQLTEITQLFFGQTLSRQ